MSMAVCAKMVSGDLRFGPKIHIAFPRDFSNRLVMDITDEINDFLAERLGGLVRGERDLVDSGGDVEFRADLLRLVLEDVERASEAG